MQTLKIVKTLSLVLAGAVITLSGPASAQGQQQKLTTLKPNPLARSGAGTAMMSISMHRKMASTAFKSLANTRARRGFNPGAMALLQATVIAQTLGTAASGPPLVNGTISPQGVGAVTARPGALARPPVPVLTSAAPLPIAGDPLAAIDGPPVATGAVSPQGTATATARPGALLKRPPVPAITLPAPLPAPVTIH